MRWQDETPIHELIAEGAQIDNAYLTVARVGEDRKEAQIGSQPINDAEDARAWLDRMADAALGDADDVRLRVRLWRSDRTPIRSVQTRVWPVEDETPDFSGATDVEADVSDDAHDTEFNPSDDDGDHRDPATTPPTAGRRSNPNGARRNPNPPTGHRSDEPADPPKKPGTALTLRRPAHLTVRSRQSAPPTSRPVAHHAQPRPAAPFAPMYAPPCPTCAAATTTTALLQSRISELSSMLGAAQSAVRDSRRDAEQAQESARARGRRAKEAEAEVARLRSQNTDLTQEVRRLRTEEKRLDAQVADFYNSAVHIRNTLAEIDD